MGLENFVQLSKININSDSQDLRTIYKQVNISKSFSNDPEAETGIMK